MADVPVQVIVAAFTDFNGASKALKQLQEAKSDALIGIEDAAVITKDANGKVKIKETADMRAGKGATIGAVAGGVVGLLAGPVGWAALGGGALGGLAAKMRDGGFPDARLKQLGEGLTPNSSMLVAVIEHQWVADMERELAEQGADLATQALSDDIARQLKAGGNVVYTVVDTGDAVVAERDTQVRDTAVAGDLGAAATAPGAEGQAPPMEDSSGTGTSSHPPQSGESAPGPSPQAH
jgi:uncharacterized membrane protein